MLAQSRRRHSWVPLDAGVSVGVEMDGMGRKDEGLGIGQYVTLYRPGGLMLFTPFHPFLPIGTLIELSMMMMSCFTL